MGRSPPSKVAINELTTVASVWTNTADIYFGPKAPAGQESNWLYTAPGNKWFPWFRMYGPENAIMDKSWKLPDIELIQGGHRQ